MPVTGNNLFFNKSLSIRLCTGGFSFFVNSPQEEVKFRHVPFQVDPHISMAANLKRALSSLDFIQEKYHSVQVLLESPVVYLPFEQFEEEKVQEVFLYNHPKECGKVVQFNVLTDSNLVLLFCLDKAVLQLLKDYFQQVHLYAIDTPIIEHLSYKAKNRDAQKLYAVFQNSSILLVAMQAGKISYVNSFSSKSNQDSCYYILHVWQLVGFDQREDELYLVQDPAQLQDDLRVFIRKVFHVSPAAEFNRSEIAVHPESTYDIQTLLSAHL